MILEIQHETVLDYSEPVREWLCELRMEPANDPLQRCHSFRIDVSQPANVASYVDGFGNRVHHFNLLAPATSLRILAASIVETEDPAVSPNASRTAFPLDADTLAGARHLPFASATGMDLGFDGADRGAE